MEHLLEWEEFNPINEKQDIDKKAANDLIDALKKSIDKNTLDKDFKAWQDDFGDPSYLVADLKNKQLYVFGYNPMSKGHPMSNFSVGPYSPNDPDFKSWIDGDEEEGLGAMEEIKDLKKYLTRLASNLEGDIK